jgi:hypothetical protein
MSNAADTIKTFKNGKVMVTRGIVTATVDPREHGMNRWRVEVRPLGRFKPVVGLKGYRVYYGPFEAHGKVNSAAITEQDAITLAGKHPVGDKLAMARKMLDWHFEEEKRVQNLESAQ